MRHKLSRGRAGVAIVCALAACALGVVYVAEKSRLRRSELPVGALDRAHPHFGWLHIPHSEFTGESVTPPGGVRIRINSKGFRDAEYAYRKPRGTFRLLVLGDGFTVGYETPIELVWHTLLERELNATSLPAARIEVIAAATAGWGTDQQLLYYRYEGYKFQPDLVIVQFVTDDVLSNDTTLIAPGLKARKPYFVLSGNGLVVRNLPFSGDIYARGSRYGLDRLDEFWTRAWRRVRALRIVARLVTGQLRASHPECPEYLRVYAVDHALRYQHAWTLTGRLLKELASEVTARGHRLALAYFPDRRQSESDDWNRTLACGARLSTLRWERDRPNTILGSVAQQERIAYLDLTPYFREHVLATGRTLHLRDGHFNIDGHRRAAEVTRGWLVRQRFVPRP